MKTTQTINLGSDTIIIDLHDNGTRGSLIGSIRNEIAKATVDDFVDSMGCDDRDAADAYCARFNAAVETLESVVLAMACNGVDLESDDISQAISLAYDTIGNDFGP
jgi:hydroxylamine reductase (hybrid-cluster protein)